MGAEDRISVEKGGFVTTQWNMVQLAGQGDGEASVEALAFLCRVYWQPVFVGIRSRGFSRDEAMDLTQDFFVQLIEKRVFATLKRENGRLRSFLGVALRNFLCNAKDRARTKKRGGGVVFLSVEQVELESEEAFANREVRDGMDLYDLRWAWGVVHRAMDEVRMEYARTNRGAIFETLSKYMMGSTADAPREELASSLGLSMNAMDVALHRLRNRFGAKFRAIVTETVVRPEDVQDELQFLIATIGR